jgi:LDH2 family malate/lactate/ureidoglycolate dehydrogenase
MSFEKLEDRCMKILSHDTIRRICLEILEAVNTPREEAEIVADSLVKADLRGLNSHGISRLPSYVTRIENGTIVPGAPFAVVRETPSTALIDGECGFGQVIGVKAMRLAIEKARVSGTGAVSVRNTNHFGMSAYYALKALEKDLIGIVTCNTGPYVVPWGGRIRMLGTNPIAIAIPSGQEIPFVLDMATSAVSLGKIEQAAKEKKPIPEGWAVNQKGEVTTNAQDALHGALLPFGGPKGFGLSLIIDILSGALSGAACLTHTRSLYPENEKSNMGQFYLALNVDSFIPVQEFKARVDCVISELKSSPPGFGFHEILIPGEIEYRTEKKRLKEGIPIDDETMRAMESLCKRLKVNLQLLLSKSN